MGTGVRSGPHSADAGRCESVHATEGTVVGSRTLPNNEMQRTSHGQDGGSPLISVLAGPDLRTRRPPTSRDGHAGRASTPGAGTTVRGRRADAAASRRGFTPRGTHGTVSQPYKEQ